MFRIVKRDPTSQTGMNSETNNATESSRPLESTGGNASHNIENRRRSYGRSRPCDPEEPRPALRSYRADQPECRGDEIAQGSGCPRCSSTHATPPRAAADSRTLYLRSHAVFVDAHGC